MNNSKKSTSSATRHTKFVITSLTHPGKLKLFNGIKTCKISTCQGDGPYISHILTITIGWQRLRDLQRSENYRTQRQEPRRYYSSFEGRVPSRLTLISRGLPGRTRIPYSSTYNPNSQVVKYGQLYLDYFLCCRSRSSFP